MDKTKPTPIYTYENDRDRKPITFFRNHKNKKKYVDTRRKYIYDVLSDRMDNKINRLDCYRDSDIQKAVDLYDELFLGNSLKNALILTSKDETVNAEIDVNIKESYKEDAMLPGITKFESLYSIGVVKFRIYRGAFRKTFVDSDKKVSSSYRCFDRLECIQQTI